VIKSLDEKIKKAFAQIIIPRIEIAIKESLEKHATITLKNLLGETFKENFMEIIAPSFDKSSREMFLQLSEAFSRGIENYQKKYELTMSKTTTTTPTSNLESMVVKEITFAVQTLSEVSEKMNKTIVETQRKILNDYQNRMQQMDGTDTISLPKNQDQDKRSVSKKKFYNFLSKKISKMLLQRSFQNKILN